MSWMQVTVKFRMLSTSWDSSLYLFALPCLKWAPDAVELQVYESEKGFPLTYDMILLLRVSQNSWFCWKSIPVATDKYCNFCGFVDQQIHRHKSRYIFNTYLQEKHGSGRVNATTPPIATYFSYAAMLSRKVSPPPALLGFLLKKLGLCSPLSWEFNLLSCK